MDVTPLWYNCDDVVAFPPRRLKSVMAQPDIPHAANELIELYGDDAVFVAARRAEELRAVGGEEYARWKLIMMAILATHAARKTDNMH